MAFARCGLRSSLRMLASGVSDDPARPDADVITILRSRNGMLTKRIEAGRRVVGFTAGALFLVHEQPVAGFPDMTDLLPRVAADP